MRTLPLLIALAMLSLLVSCSSSSSTPSTPTLNLITVTPTSPSIAAGLTQQFKAQGTYSDGSNKDLTTTATWSSSSSSVATIASTGLATTKTMGSTTIAAALSGISGSTTLDVSAATLKTITVTPANGTMNPGTFLQFTATGNYTDGSTQDLTSSAKWSSADSMIVSVSTTGLGAAVTNPPPGVGAATIITAASGSISGNTGVSVAAPTLSSILITDGNLTLAQGTTHGYTAIGLYSDGGQREVGNQATWASTDPGVATIASTGVGTAVAPGTSMITAEVGTVTSPAVTLTVTNPTIATIVVTPVMHTLAPATQLAFNAVGIFSDLSVQDITQSVSWGTSAGGVATVNTTDHPGLVSAVAAGPVNITAMMGGMTGTAPLTVSAATVSSVTVTPATINIGTATNTELVAKAQFSDGSQQIVNNVATWMTSADSIAAVDNTGSVTGEAPGTATITASFGGMSGNSSVTVESVSGIAISPTTATIPVGAIEHLQLVATLADSSTQTATNAATWTSGTPAVAPVGDVSNTHGQVSGQTSGTTLIGAFFEPLITSATVTVSTATLTSITLTAVPPAPNIPVNGSQAYKLTANYSDGTTQTVTSQAQWSSSDPTVAVVKAGFATPAATGTTTITAAFGGKTQNTTLTVQ